MLYWSAEAQIFCGFSVEILIFISQIALGIFVVLFARDLRNGAFYGIR